MKLCLITCNIRFDNPADGDNAWNHRRSLLIDTLMAHSPDIIATQEGRYTQLMNMAEMLPEFELIDAHRSWIKERMYPSFFIRKSKFEILKSDDIWLSETPQIAGSRSFESAFPRLMTWVKVQPVNSENNLLFVNTHLDHIKPETRMSQIGVLSQEIRKFWKEESSIVFMGDFNDSPDSQVRKLLEKDFLGVQDAWKLYNSTEQSSHHAFKGEMQNGARIDWILVDKRLKIETCIMDKSRRDGKYPTDHFPIVCNISI
ncbi:MAG TPA: endonuclease/exonuclease/phosphatase family protein [Bacteriovoracaceae bacterium]|nr:endonuclease/exonuclease/phosphatase family protein [Bacteriovoracaceae bacterium]